MKKIEEVFNSDLKYMSVLDFEAKERLKALGERRISKVYLLKLGHAVCRYDSNVEVANKTFLSVNYNTSEILLAIPGIKCVSTLRLDGSLKTQNRGDLIVLNDFLNRLDYSELLDLQLTRVVLVKNFFLFENVRYIKSDLGNFTKLSSSNYYKFNKLKRIRLTRTIFSNEIGRLSCLRVRDEKVLLKSLGFCESLKDVEIEGICYTDKGNSGSIFNTSEKYVFILDQRCSSRTLILNFLTTNDLKEGVKYSFTYRADTFYSNYARDRQFFSNRQYLLDRSTNEVLIAVQQWKLNRMEKNYGQQRWNI